MIAIEVDWEGGNILAVELADRESQSSWKDVFLTQCHVRFFYGRGDPTIGERRVAVHPQRNAVMAFISRVESNPK